MLWIKVSDTNVELKCGGSALDISTELSLALASIAQTIERGTQIPVAATIEAVANTANDISKRGMLETVTEQSLWREVQ